MRLPHIYRFYLSLTSPRRVGVRVLACTTRGGRGRGEGSEEGEADAAKTREKICGMPVERRKTSAGMREEGKGSKVIGFYLSRLPPNLLQLFIELSIAQTDI